MTTTAQKTTTEELFPPIVEAAIKKAVAQLLIVKLVKSFKLTQTFQEGGMGNITFSLENCRVTESSVSENISSVLQGVETDFGQKFEIKEVMAEVNHRLSKKHTLLVKDIRSK